MNAKVAGRDRGVARVYYVNSSYDEHVADICI
jgi:hypothetical protein